MFRAEDVLNDREPVVVKLMLNPEQCEREVSEREGLGELGGQAGRSQGWPLLTAPSQLR